MSRAQIGLTIYSVVAMVGTGAIIWVMYEEIARYMKKKPATKMLMRPVELETFLFCVMGAVEATSYEQLCLWQEHHQTAHRAWIENNMGLSVTVGHVGDMPVNISLSTAIVSGHKVLFYDDISQVVDHEMIEEWLKKNLPASAHTPDGRLNKTNAMNFLNIFRW